MAITLERVTRLHEDTDTSPVPPPPHPQFQAPSDHPPVQPLGENITQKYPSEKDTAVAAAVTGLAEDVHNQLTAISGYLQLLNIRYPNDARIKKAVESAMMLGDIATRYSNSALSDGGMRFERYYDNPKSPYVPDTHSHSPTYERLLRLALTPLLVQKGFSGGTINRFIEQPLNK